MTVQSALVQQVTFAIQVFDAAQIFWPLGQPQVPTGVAQVWPLTVQSVSLQQFALPMQLALAAHTRVPLGQLQTPPLQVSPAFGHVRGG